MNFRPALVAILFTLSFSSIPLWLEAQVYVGARLGANTLSTDRFQKNHSYGVKPGYEAGIVLRTFTDPHAGVQLEVNFTQKGYREVSDRIFENSKATGQPDSLRDLTLNYIEVPLLATFKIPIGKFKLHIVAGMYGAYSISGKDVYRYADENKPNRESAYIFDEDRDSRLIYGLTGGIGAGREFGFGVLEVEGRYVYGLNNLFKPASEFVPGFSHPSALGVFLNYHFNLGK